jgi:glycosyltransferase involved in cell wall biosynthesis
MLMKPGEPDVSVVIPAFNAAAFIAQALDSVLGQTLGSLEVIVIDDGSVDETSAIVERFAARDSRVRLFHQENAGVGAARNTGIRHARGTYIAPLDADDVWSHDKLQKQVARMEECGSATGMVYCWSNLIDQTGRWLEVNTPHTAEGRVARALIVRNIVGNSSVPLFRATALSDVGAYLTRAEQGGAEGCEDWDLALRVAERHDVRVVAEPLVGYRQVASAMSFRGEGMRRSYAVMCDRLRARNPDLWPSLLRWSAGRFHQYLASQAYKQGDYKSAILHTVRAVMVDPVALLNTRSQIRFAWSVVRLVSGRVPAEPPSATEAALPTRATLLPRSMPPRPRIGNALYERIQSRRWSTVQGSPPSAHPWVSPRSEGRP